MRTPNELLDVVAEIQETYRRRRSLHRQEKGLTLAIKAKERSHAVYRIRAAGGELPVGKFPKAVTDDVLAVADAYPELYEALTILEKGRKGHEKRLKALSRLLPVHDWWSEIHGCGELGLAIIIGEAGNIGDYGNPAKLWKRMGVGLVGDGIQRRVKGQDALLHGYDPERRSAIWTIGDSLLKKQNEYREVYLARKDYEIERAEANGLQVVPAARIPAKRKDEFMSQGHVHRRSQRYMEKRLLRNLWRAWRQAENDVTPQGSMPDA